MSMPPHRGPFDHQVLMQQQQHQQQQQNQQQHQQQQQQQQQQQNFGHHPAQSQATPAQPIRLAHPTSYHLEQKNRRERVTFNDAPPTPKNSYPNTVDPSMLAKSLPHSFPSQPAIKQEESLDMHTADMDFEGSTLMSPLSNTPLGSPPNNLDQEDISGSMPRNAHIDTNSQLGESPGTIASIYSPGPDTTEFMFEGGDSSTSVGPMDMKHIGNNTRFPFHQSPCSNSFPSISMSLPVTLSTADIYGQSFEPTSYNGSLFSDMQVVGDFHMTEEPGEKAKQAQLNFEKRRRRRESHNAVERRRRDNINEKIQELSTLLPDVQLDSNKPNKGVILRKSVDYIKELQGKVEQADMRTQELEAQLANLRAKSGEHLQNGSSGEPIVL